MSPDPTLDLVYQVQPVVAANARRTPLLPSDWLSARFGCEVWYKCENFQATGSFKIRGALAQCSLLTPEQRAVGVLTASAGNHGLGLAAAARLLELPCKVVVPSGAPEVKVRGIEAQGAEVVRSPHTGYDATQAWTLERADALGGTFVSAFDDPGVIAGNGGTTLLEILDDAPPFDAVVVPCGGGGMIAGMGLVAKHLQPRLRVIGVNSDASPGMYVSRRDHRAHLEIDSQPTIAEGLEGGVGERTFRMVEQYVDDILAVKEATVRKAVVEIARHERMLVEGSSAVAVAALLEGQVQAKRICIVLTGSNIDLARVRELLEETA